jgi:transcriptional regulator with GAF, ATPase, and Fis domain
VKGAFTGAARERTGRFELADGGTLFLDEIGEIPLSHQAKLLRVLQEGEFERVGDDRTRKVDVRIIAATNRRLERDVSEGKFRRDLYFRLNVFPIEMPPLRERKEDVRALAVHFLAAHAARLGRRELELSPDDHALLLGYDWPGNVRELTQVLERAVILSPAPPLRLTLPEASPVASNAPPPREGDAVDGAPTGGRAFRTVDDLRQIEIDMINDALDAGGGRVSGKGGAAERLGIRPSTLRDRIRALGIRRP